MINFFQRTITGIFFVALLVASILLGGYYFGVIFCLFSMFSVKEFHKITSSYCKTTISTIVPMILSGILFASAYFNFVEKISFPFWTIYLLLLFVAMGLELFRQKENPILNWAMLFLGQGYVALPYALLCPIAMKLTGEYHAFLLLAMFVMIWVYDSGAYLFGITLGKHKMFPRVSPKKSWEGFVGGVCFTMLFAYIFSRFIPELSVWQWLFFAVIIVVFATIGDLTESLLKRTIGVKDSGSILPGHGGLLDRFDSLLFVAIGIYVYLSILFF